MLESFRQRPPPLRFQSSHYSRTGKVAPPQGTITRGQLIKY